MNMESLDEMILTGENLGCQRITFLNAILTTTWTDLGANLGLCSGRLVTNPLCHGMATMNHDTFNTRQHLMFVNAKGVSMNDICNMFWL
jgi:hypothetical protein